MTNNTTIFSLFLAVGFYTEDRDLHPMVSTVDKDRFNSLVNELKPLIDTINSDCDDVSQSRFEQHRARIAERNHYLEYTNQPTLTVGEGLVVFFKDVPLSEDAITALRSITVSHWENWYLTTFETTLL